MLETAQALIKKAAKNLDLNEDQVNDLLKSNAEHIFEIALKDGRKFQAYRIQHNNKLGPYKGGLRFHPEVDLEEVRALATLMSLKTSAVGLPLGGGKGGVAVDARKMSKAELEEISRLYVQHLKDHIGPDKDVPGPDINTNETIMDWMADEYERLTGDTTRASFTGKPVAKGGSEGRTAATGQGGVYALEALMKAQDKTDQKLTYAVQGFGNVGSYFGTIAEKDHPNWKLVAASDSSGGVYKKDGLSAKSLESYKTAGGRLADYDQGNKISNAELLALDVDVLVLAALGDAVHEGNVEEVKAKVVLELANGPVHDSAYRQLLKRGVVIVPDVIANAGGVIVSYLEWLQNKSNERWTESKVNTRLEKYIKEAFNAAYEYSEQKKISLKEAAATLALKRIVEA